MSIPTLFVATAIVLAALAAVMVYAASLQRLFPGFREWALGQVCGSAGMVLLGLRGRLPDLLTVVVGNLALLLHPALTRRGFRRFYALPAAAPELVEPGLVAACLAALAWFTWGAPDVRARIVAFSATSALLHLGAALTPLRSPEARRSPTQRTVSVVIGAVALAYLGRAAWLAALGPVPGLFVDPSVAAITLTALTGQVLLVCGLLYLNFDRAGEALRAAERERVLRESEQRFRALIEKSTDVVYVLDADRVIRFFSPGGTAALGWTEAEVVGRPGMELVHPEDEPQVLRRFEGLLAAPGATSRATYRLRHRDGTWRLVDAVGRNHLADPALRGVVVSARDITEQRRLQEQLLEAQKLESVGQLAGGVAHDFNNLLTAILGGGEGLKESMERGAPPLADDVQAVLDAGARASELTRQLLAFARRQPIAPTRLDLGQVVQELERLVRRLLPESIALRVEVGDAPAPVLADAGQLRQVVLNLAVNARDAMPSGGRLVIETACERLDGAAAAAGVAPGEWVRLTVRDSGGGMSAEARAHLFEPFFTTKGRGRGTGLGLAAVHGIVKQSQGAITVESEPGRGTAIHVRLPRTEVTAEDREADVGRASPGTSGAVLLVEDDALVRNVAERALRRAGYQVLVAGDGQDALSLPLPAQGLALLVTDVVMPGLDGRQLAERLRQRQPGLRVLYVSGFTQDALAHHGVLDHGVELLEKPFVAATLVARVQQVLARPD
ncbi:MAG: PAS domain S-box protein [Deltaproteobacteria bacterium]|nr:PAS domain S-box protein [Deltaproteobacteria bacterium]